MRPEIPFWTWVIARRIPIFMLITTVILALGASLISQHTVRYFSSAELTAGPEFAQMSESDAQTQFEFLRYRALTSGSLAGAVTRLNLISDPVSRIRANFNANSGKITLGYSDANPEMAIAMTRDIVKVFVETAQVLHRQTTQRRVDTITAQTSALRENLERISTPEEQRITEDLLKASLAELNAAKAALQVAPPDVLNVVAAPSLARTSAGTNKTSMYLALTAFAIFCGLVAILVLEWLDTVIRRPKDIEEMLGAATFGVIPDLQLQPIQANPLSKRGI